MTGLDHYWSYLTAESMLGFGVSVLMVLAMAGLSVWFACSVLQNVMKVGRYVHRSDYEALLRENERLTGALADAREENDYLRKLYRSVPARAEGTQRSAA